MSKIRMLLTLGVVLLWATFAAAQASRTWVSGVGDDANPCSRTAPCKTFAGAISKTAAGGEIDALDAAGYGAVTITKAITIDGGGGQVASVLVSGTNGIVVQAGPSDVVILRNLRIAGIGTGINGVRFLAGKALFVENCDIFGFTTNGLDISLASSAAVYVRHTTVDSMGGDGIRAATTSGLATVNVEDSEIANVNGVGLHATNHSKIVADSSVVSHAGTGVRSESSTGDGETIVTNSRIVYSTASGVQSGPGGGNVILSNDQISYNTPGFTVSAGAIFSFGNNRINSNFGPNGGSLTPTTQQ